MKTVILAGGLGTRISEETENKPKPMVLLDDKPILWHLMNIYASQGFSDFIIASGYRSEVIEGWVDGLKTNWNIQVCNTGNETQTGGRIKICMNLVGNERVMVTYGDGLGNVNLRKLIEFHERQERLATVTAVRPPARFGVLEISNNVVTHFGEKNQADAGWINGGFFVLESQIANMISNLNEPFETGVLPLLASKGELSAYLHGGFWKPMDTLRERNELSELASRPSHPWLLV